MTLLVEAVAAAGLVETLAEPGPFTILAPTNAAFATLLTELGVTKDALFADKPLLTSVLTYHVLDGAVAKASIPLGQPIRPRGGGFFKIDSEAGPAGQPASLRITDGRNRLRASQRTMSWLTTA